MSTHSDEILKSGEKIPRVSVPEDLLNNLLEIPKLVKSDIVRMSPQTKWLMVAGIAAMIVLNVFVAFQYNNSNTPNNTETLNYFSYLKQL